MRRGPAHTHGPREQAHGMRSLKTLIPFEDARRMALDLVRPIDRTEIVITPHFTKVGACSLCFFGTAMIRMVEKTGARLKVPVPYQP